MQILYDLTYMWNLENQTPRNREREWCGRNWEDVGQKVQTCSWKMGSGDLITAA